MTQRTLIEMMMANIEKTGWSNIVTSTATGNLLGYTVGLTMWRLPELCTYGEEPLLVHEMLNELAGRQREAGEFDDGQVTLFRGIRLRLDKAHDLQPFNMMRMFFADNVPAPPRALLISPCDGDVHDTSDAGVLVGTGG